MVGFLIICWLLFTLVWYMPIKQIFLPKGKKENREDSSAIMGDYTTTHRIVFTPSTSTKEVAKYRLPSDFEEIDVEIEYTPEDEEEIEENIEIDNAVDTSIRFEEIQAVAKLALKKTVTEEDVFTFLPLKNTELLNQILTTSQIKEKVEMMLNQVDEIYLSTLPPATQMALDFDMKKFI